MVALNKAIRMDPMSTANRMIEKNLARATNFSAFLLLSMLVLFARMASAGIVSDDFNRPSLGSNWAIDSGSFNILGDALQQNSGQQYTTAQLRYVADTTASPDQFGKLRIVSSAAHTFGFIFRSGSAPGPHYEVHLPKGTTQWRWERYDPSFVERLGDCAGDGFVADGNWVGATVEGTGVSTLVSVWRWNSDPDLGNDVDIVNNWGPPDCTMVSAGPIFVDAGNQVGIRAYTGSSAASGFADDWASGDISAASTVCGDGILEVGEACDDGNNTGGDGCRADCTVEACGDAILDPGEACDDGNTVAGDGCDASCMIEPSTCGNFIVEGLETCDDGNTISGDGCRADCTVEICGDGILDFGEACDDGNNLPGDGCRADCTPEICGDGTLDAGEACDDGNILSGDGCDASCMIEAPVCGNAILELGEACDDGNLDSGDGCRANCTIEVCGDAILDPNEACDDGNTVAGDGCDASCMIEPSTCGDFIIEGFETCDDGNTVSGDGCDSSCQVEPVNAIFSDNFDRAVLGSEWSVDSGVWYISNNVLTENTGSGYTNTQLRYVGGTTVTPDQFGKLQIISPATHTFGFIFRSSETQGAHYQVHGPSNTAEWRWERYDPNFVQRLANCSGDTGPSNGDWIGAAISGSGAQTNLSVWRWDDDPDSGQSTNILENWGPPDCVMMSNGPTFVDSGSYSGIRAYTGSSTAAAFADNWTGGDFDGNVAPPLPQSGITLVFDENGSSGVPNSARDPDGVAIDSEGNVYIAACGYSLADEGVFKVTPFGIKTKIMGGDGDGTHPATCPVGLDFDSVGNLYVAAYLSDNVFKIDTSGNITRIIDSSGAGPGKEMAGPLFIAIDRLTDSVYVTGNISDNVLAYRNNGVIDEIIDATGDGSNVLTGPFGAAVNSVGEVYVAGSISDNVFHISTSGEIQEILDSSGGGAPGGLDNPHSIIFDSADNMYVTGNRSDNVLMRTPSGIVSEILDSSGDGLGNILDNPSCIDVGTNGNIYVAAFLSRNVFEITPTFEITQIMDGTGDGVNPFFGPSDDCLAVDGAHNVYALGTTEDKVFRISP